MEPEPPAVEARSPNHWTTREVPGNSFFKKLFPLLDVVRIAATLCPCLSHSFPRKNIKLFQGPSIRWGCVSVCVSENTFLRGCCENEINKNLKCFSLLLHSLWTRETDCLGLNPSSALPLISSFTPGKLFKVFVFQFSHRKMCIIIVP